MIRVGWSPVALADLKKINAYLEREAGLRISISQTERILNAIRFLQRFPLTGKLNTDLDCRTSLAEGTPYIVFYRTYEDSLRLLRIRHANRKPLRRPPHA